ncbi:MAG: AMP-binding protein [Pseudomonadota bacterium]
MTPQSVYELFSVSAKKWPERPVLNVLSETAEIYGIPSGEISYAEAQEKIEEFRDTFGNAGYVAGQRVMLLLENRPDFFLIWLALNSLGLSVVPVNPDLKIAEQEHMIGNAEPALAIATPDRCDELRKAGRAASRPIPVISVDDDVPAPFGSPVFETADQRINHESAILYTSGTTGKPKGCVLTNDYFSTAAEWYATAGGVCELNTDGERMITPLPIFHMNAMAYSFMAMISLGGCLTALDRFHPRTWWNSVAESKATCLHYLGVMPSMLMGMPEQTTDKSQSVRFGFGAGVDPTLHVAFEKRFGFPLVEAWAMTETGAGAVVAANQEPRRPGNACFGRPGPDIEFKLIDDEGKDVSAGSPGELLVRRTGSDPRKGFFKEYWKNPEETGKAWADGWFHTGDVVRQLESGDMIFVDRKKNVIRRSGENIAAVEVESVLLKHPAIDAVAVAAVPDEIRGDEVFACLQVNKPLSEALALEIVKWSLSQMAYYKAPGYIAFVDSLPITGTNKIQRAKLKQQALDLLDHPHTADTRSLKKRQNA